MKKAPRRDISVRGETYAQLRAEAKRRGISVTQLVGDIITSWYEGQPLLAGKPKPPTTIPDRF
jgi:hypothetical protein